MTIGAAKEMLRGYQAEMVDLSAIDIPDMPQGPTLVHLSKEQAQALNRGESVIIQINERDVIIALQ